jgi:hypothetical protein
VKRYPFEVLIPAGYGVYGVILADQARTIDWLSRKVSFTREYIDAETINKANAVDLYYSIIRDETEDDFNYVIVVGCCGCFLWMSCFFENKGYCTV